MAEINDCPRAGWEQQIKKDLGHDPKAGQRFWPDSVDDENPSEDWTWEFDQSPELSGELTGVQTAD